MILKIKDFHLSVQNEVGYFKIMKGPVANI